VDAQWLIALRDGEALALRSIEAGPRFELRVERAPFAVVYDAHRVTTLQVELDAEGCALRLARCTSRGHERQYRTERIAPSNAARRIVERDAARLLRACADALSRGDYRHREPARIEGNVLEVLDAQSILRVAIDADDTGGVLAIRSAPIEHAPPVTLARLASWMRGRWRRDPWLRRWAEHACTEIAAQLLRVERANGYFELRARLVRLPSAEAFVPWLIALRAEPDRADRGER
jgi:hypothetical protein